MFAWNSLVVAAREASIEAPALRAITLAQWALESGWGTSRLATEHANFAGLKWRPEMEGLAKPVQYQAHDGLDTYCAFASVAAFIAGYWRFVNRSPYKGWQVFASDPEGYIRFLHGRGYAQDAAYPGKVMALLDEAQALLEQVGASSEAQEAERPDRIQVDAALDRGAFTMPDFVTIGQVRHAFQGVRPNGLEGAIVHYDAGRLRPRIGAADPTFGARSSLESGASNGYAYATIARNGKILLPSNMDWNRWGYHAGASVCPKTDRSGVSKFYVGFEVNSPGMVYPTADADVYVPWFNAVHKTVTVNNKSVKVVALDAKGRATVARANDETYRKAELRFIKASTGNIAPAAYVPFTAAQFDSLVAVLLWLKLQYPKTFRLDYVLGHDEVSPGRKIDPGGALGKPVTGGPGPAMTMAEFRSYLLHAWAERQV